MLWYVPSSSPQLSPHSVASSSVGYGVVVSSLFKVGTSVSAVGFMSEKNGAEMLFRIDPKQNKQNRQKQIGGNKYIFFLMFL